MPLLHRLLIARVQNVLNDLFTRLCVRLYILIHILNTNVLCTYEHKVMKGESGLICILCSLIRVLPDLYVPGRVFFKCSCSESSVRDINTML